MLVAGACQPARPVPAVPRAVGVPAAAVAPGCYRLVRDPRAVWAASGVLSDATLPEYLPPERFALDTTQGPRGSVGYAARALDTTTFWRGDAGRGGWWRSMGDTLGIVFRQLSDGPILTLVAAGPDTLAGYASAYSPGVKIRLPRGPVTAVRIPCS